MTAINLPYVDKAIEYTEDGGEFPFWRHLHWGLFDEPDLEDDSRGRYYAAAEAMTGHILDVGQVADGRRVLDVGCGFGGTLDHLRGRSPGCRLVGLNIDERQLSWARQRLAPSGPIPFVTGDGCRLPVADGSFDHVLAVECLFHFPSRKQFFREAARVLRPGGTLALSDFLLAAGTPGTFLAAGDSLGAGTSGWYGRSTMPLTSSGYQRLGRGAGFDLLVDDDVSTAAFPSYAALRRLYGERQLPDGVQAIEGMENLALAGVLQYHVLAFRRRAEQGDESRRG